MQTSSTLRKRLQLQVIGFFVVVLAIIFMGNRSSLKNEISVSEEPLCSIKNKKVKSVAGFNEMLFSIKSFSLYETEITVGH
jgi:hypothetical protein